jgi:hypothetical protein
MHRGFYPDHIHTNCDKVDSGVCRLHGKGESLQGYSPITVDVPPDLGMYPILDRDAILCLGRSF